MNAGPERTTFTPEIIIKNIEKMVILKMIHNYF